MGLRLPSVFFFLYVEPNKLNLFVDVLTVEYKLNQVIGFKIYHIIWIVSTE